MLTLDPSLSLWILTSPGSDLPLDRPRGTGDVTVSVVSVRGRPVPGAAAGAGSPGRCSLSVGRRACVRGGKAQ